jgi:hypothetical protein
LPVSSFVEITCFAEKVKGISLKMIFSADTESNETGETNLWRPLSESISDGRPSKPECIETPKVESNFANANGNGISPQSKAVLPPFSMKAGISAGCETPLS